MEPSADTVSVTELVSAVSVVLFIFLFVLGAVATLARFVRYKLLHEDPPLLLKLNAVERTLLATPFALILISRVLVALGVVEPEMFRDQLWWVLVTSVPAIIAAGIYAFAELFVIERRTSVDDAPPGEPPVEGDDAPVA